MLWPAVHHKVLFVVHRQALILYDSALIKFSQINSIQAESPENRFPTRCSKWSSYTLLPQNNV
jgi:hypothetical protein